LVRAIEATVFGAHPGRETLEIGEAISSVIVAVVICGALAAYPIFVECQDRLQFRIRAPIAAYVFVVESVAVVVEVVTDLFDRNTCVTRS